MALLQKIPGMRMEAKTASQKASFAKQEFALKKLEAQRDWYLDQQKLAILRQDKALERKYLELAQQQAAADGAGSRMGRDANGNVMPGFHIENGQVVENGWKLGKDGLPVKVGGGKGGKRGSTSSTVPGTPAYKAAAKQKVGAAADNILRDVKGLERKPTDDEVLNKGADPTKMIRPTYREAYQEIWRTYKHLAVNPATKKQLDPAHQADPESERVQADQRTRDAPAVPAQRGWRSALGAEHLRRDRPHRHRGADPGQAEAEEEDQDGHGQA